MKLLMRMTWGILFLGAALAQQPNTEPAAPEQKCMLDGTATDAITGEVLRKVTVRLMPASGTGPEYVATTDAAGRFHFEGFPPGDYQVEGERAGYLRTALGARRPESEGTTLHFGSGDKLPDLELKLTRCSSISGKVLDENGEPISEAWIIALNQSWVHGHREYQNAGQGTVNDRGEYRISDLNPGRYYLRADIRGRRFVPDPGKPEEEIVPAFYPDSQTMNNAAPVALESGQSLTGLNFRLHTREVFHVRGRVKPGTGNRDVMVSIDSSEWALFNFGGSRVETDGRFDVSGVPSGSYVLQALERPGAGILGTAPVEVKGANLDGIVIPLDPEVQVRGTIHRDPDAGKTSGIRITVESWETHRLRMGGGAVEHNGEFKIENLPAGKYLLTVQTPDPKTYVASIQYGGQEVLGTPIDFSPGANANLDVWIKKGTGRVEGTVGGTDPSDATTSETKRASPSEVVLVSEPLRLNDQAVLFGHADQNGHFLFDGVPPGNYYAFANDDVDRGLWENRDFLSQVEARGVEVEVPENGNVQIRVPVLRDDDVERAIASLGQ